MGANPSHLKVSLHFTALHNNDYEPSDWLAGELAAAVSGESLPAFSAWCQAVRDVRQAEDLAEQAHRAVRDEKEAFKPLRLPIDQRAEATRLHEARLTDLVERARLADVVLAEARGEEVRLKTEFRRVVDRTSRRASVDHLTQLQDSLHALKAVIAIQLVGTPAGRQMSQNVLDAITQQTLAIRILQARNWDIVVDSLVQSFGNPNE